MSSDFFPDIERIAYEGPDSDNPLAFRWYDADRVVAGKTMARTPALRGVVLALVQLRGHRHLRCRHPRPPVARSGPRPDGGRPREDGRRLRVRRRSSARRSTASTTATSRPRARRSPSRAATSTRWSSWLPATRNARECSCSGAPRTCSRTLASRPGAATNPDPDLFRVCRRAGRALHERDAPPRRRRTTSCGAGVRATRRCSTPTCDASSTSSGGSSTSSSSTSTPSGSTGLILIEPKPFEPTKHQYDYDVAAVHAFLQKYGLEDEVKVNIEVNHATLAGHDFAPRDRRSVRRRHLRLDRRQRRRRPHSAGISTGSRCPSSR